MQLLDLLNNERNINVTLTAGDLKAFASELVDAARAELEAVITAQRSEKYLSADKVAQMLDVDRTTLWRWNKRDYLRHIEVGGKRRYKMSDVQRLLNGASDE